MATLKSADETGIEQRAREISVALAPNQTARYDLLEHRTGVARHKWVNWANGRQKLTIEMLDGLFTAWPEYVAWVATGKGSKPVSALQSEICEICLSRDTEKNVITNVPHLVSRKIKGEPPRFEFGYVGTGPRELAMNILYLFGVAEPEADYFSRHFSEDLLSSIPEEGGVIPAKLIKDWLSTKRDEIESKTNERKHLEELRRRQAAEIEEEIAKFRTENT